MLKINLAIRQNYLDEATEYYVFISDTPNILGFYTCEIKDELNREIHIAPRESLTDLLNDGEAIIHELGEIVNVYVIETPAEIKYWVKCLRGFMK